MRGSSQGVEPFILPLLIAALALAAAAGSKRQTPAYWQKKCAHIAAQAKRAHGDKRARLWARLAGLDFKLAYADFAAGQAAAGGQALQQAQRHAQRAMRELRAEAAKGKKSSMRRVEFGFHQISFRLRGLLQVTPYASHQAIRQLRGFFRQARGQLLNWMFQSKPLKLAPSGKR